MTTKRDITCAVLKNEDIAPGFRRMTVALPGADTDGDGIPDDIDQCPGTPNGVTPDGRGCWVVPGLRFAFDKSDIKPRYHEHLANMVRVLRENPGMRIRIDGHTDSVGAEEYNQGLSERRAAAVRNYLTSQGIDASRVTAKGFGEKAPAYTNETEEGRAGNRRTEITALER